MSGRRYLTIAEAAATLRRGREVEQFIEHHVASDGRAAIRWLTAFKSGRTFELVIHDVEDVGSDDFFDVSEFPPLDDEEETGEGRFLATADDAESLLQTAVANGADSERWVNSGVVQDEYRESRNR
jgi:hypothetical protein